MRADTVGEPSRAVTESHMQRSDCEALEELQARTRLAGSVP